MRTLLIVTLLFSAISCTQKEVKTLGSVERIDPALDAIVNADAKVEVIAEGFEWSEGPLWLVDRNILIFSDVPTNTIHQWSEDKGTGVYLKTVWLYGLFIALFKRRRL